MFKFPQDDCPFSNTHNVLKIQGWGFCKHCGYLHDSSHKVRNPPIDVIPLRPYNLSNLKKDFVLPKFQRRQSESHIIEIAKSIWQNKFYDPVFRVVSKKKPWVVIDAGHRLAALDYLHQKFGLKAYTLILVVYPVTEAREAYIRLNQGKRLTTRDMSLAFDKDIEFFTELHDYAVHYPQYNKMAYVDLLSAVLYVRKNIRGVRMETMERDFKSVTKEEMESLKVLLSACRLVNELTEDKIYKAGLFRPLYRAVSKYNLTIEATKQLIDSVRLDQNLITNAYSRRYEELEATYQMIIEKLPKKR